MTDKVEIEGLARLRRQLKQIDAELPKALRAEFLVIGKAVASDAAAHVPRKTGRAASSVKAGVSGNNAYVQGGRKTVPYYGWLDFGGQLPSKRSGRPARTVRPRLKRGRFLYPAIDRKRFLIEQGAVRAIRRVSDEAMPNRGNR